jgi:Rhodopsin-like GPCR transmembrane domain
VLNLYESAAGYGLAALRCFSWAFFLIACTSTIRKFPEKRAFYFPFGILGSIWILAGPILIFMIVGLLDPWVRESVVYIAFAIVAFAGHAAFLWLTWPSRANKSFPYHVKTNHIGIASEDDDGADYPRHTYEPSTAPNATIIIPLSRRTEEFVTTTTTTNNGGHYNAGYVRDVEYLRSNAPASIPQQCLPSKNIHHRLPSPTHDALQLPSITNDRLFGKDTLNNDDDDDDDDDVDVDDDSEVETESGIVKHSAETVNNRMSSFESENGVPNGQQKHQNEMSTRHSSQDNDSGHLSLEVTNSNENSSSPQNDSLESDKPNSPPELAPILKENPFKVHAKAKNKIILDPIKLPESLSTNMSSTIVPRHLFTVKKIE